MLTSKFAQNCPWSGICWPWQGSKQNLATITEQLFHHGPVAMFDQDCTLLLMGLNEAAAAIDIGLLENRILSVLTYLIHHFLDDFNRGYNVYTDVLKLTNENMPYMQIWYGSYFKWTAGELEISNLYLPYHCFLLSSRVIVTFIRIGIWTRSSNVHWKAS